MNCLAQVGTWGFADWQAAKDRSGVRVGDCQSVTQQITICAAESDRFMEGNREGSLMHALPQAREQHWPLPVTLTSISRQVVS
jgi:hypothetical protein